MNDSIPFAYVCRRAGSFAFMCLCGCLFFGCKTNRAQADFDSEYYWGKKTRLTVAVPASKLCSDALDISLPISDRRMAIAELFANYVRWNSSSRDLKLAIPDFSWLDQCRVYNSTAAGGQIPVFYRRDSSIFCLSIFPDKKGYSDWNIYMAVPNHPDGSPSPEKVIELLSGRYPDKSFRLLEYAIFYPASRGNDSVTGKLMITEWFTSRGIGITIN